MANVTHEWEALRDIATPCEIDNPVRIALDSLMIARRALAKVGEWSGPIDDAISDGLRRVLGEGEIW